MHHSSAHTILKYLAREELLQVRNTTFRCVPYPQPIHLTDVRDAFESVRAHIGSPKSDMVSTLGVSLDVWCRARLFEKIFGAVFVKQKLFPVERTDNMEGYRGRELPLPALYVGSEKTQVRQIPLARERPWPFRFLLELGGTIVCVPEDRRDFVLEMRQFLNNYPQFEVRVDAKEWPTGEVLVYTWWFRQLPKNERRSNVNVPS